MLSVRRAGVLILSLLLFFCFLGVCSAVESDAAKAKPPTTFVEGSWAVDARITVKVTIKGYKPETVREYASDVFTFNSDGTFEMSYAFGYWGEKNRNFTVTFDSADIDNIFYQLFGDYDINVEFNVTKCIITGTVGKSTIRGTMKFNAKFYLPDYGIGGSIAATIPFAGSPTTDPYDVDVNQSLNTTLRGLVGKSIKAAVGK
jgi:hypothetical protein